MARQFRALAALAGDPGSVPNMIAHNCRYLLFEEISFLPSLQWILDTQVAHIQHTCRKNVRTNARLARCLSR